MPQNPTFNLHRIATIRISRRLNNSDMGKILGISGSGYKYKEDQGSFTLADLPLLAHAFDMTIEDLVRELSPATTTVAEARTEYMATLSLATIDNEIEFLQALFARREDLDRLLRTLPAKASETTPKPPKKTGDADK